MGKRHGNRRAGWLAYIVLFHLAVPLPALGEAWVLRPTAALHQKYNDNVRLSASDEESVSSTRLFASLGLIRETDITSRELLLSADAVHYQDGGDLPNDPGNKLARFSTEEKLRRGSWGTVVSYRGDTLLRTVRAVVDPNDVTPEPEDNVDEGLVTQDVDRTRIVLRPMFNYSLSERLDGGLAYRHYDTSYDNGEDTGVFDYTQNTVYGSLFYKLNETDRLRSNLEFSQYRADKVNRDYDSAMFLIGLDRAYSETFRYGGEIGLHQTDYETDTLDDSDSGLVVRLLAEKKTGETKYSGRLSRDLYPSGSGDVVRSDQLVLNAVHKTSARLWFAVRTKIFENESIRKDNPEANRRYTGIRPSLNYRITERWSLQLAYEYQKQKRDTEPDSGESNAVELTLRWSEPYSL